MQLINPTLRTSKTLQQGFNLLDLMIVVAIVSITAGIGLPSFQSLLSESRAHMYVKSLSRDLMFMRTYAISQGHSVTICPLEGAECQGDWSQNIKIFIDNDLNRIKGTKEKVIKVIDDPKLTDYFSYPRTGLTFRPDGSINGFQSGTFRYCPDTKDSLLSVGLTINQAGRQRFRDRKIKCK